MNRIFGIDLGTTNSVIAYTDPNGRTEVIAGRDRGRIVPSVVYFPDNGEPVVGTLAREHAITEPERVARLFKRGMGEHTFLPGEQPFVVDGHTWAPEALSALVLRKLAQMAEEHYGDPVRRVVITVPAYFGEAERAATRSAGEIVGLEVIRIVNEPTAAAIAHALDHPGNAGTILVFDLGGGTFDVTAMHVAASGDMRVMATGGDRRLGGMDFDELIVGTMITTAREGGLDIETEAWARQDAYAKAEEVKKKLSFTEVAGDSLTGSGRPLRFELSLGEFESLLANRLREVEDTTVYTLETADLRPADLSKIIMVGGSSRIPAFQRLLSRIYHREPSFTRNLDEDVARGAAILAAKLGDELDPRTQLAMVPEVIEVAAAAIGGSALVPFINTLASKAASQLYDEKSSKTLLRRQQNDPKQEQSSKETLIIADEGTRVIVDIPRDIDTALQAVLVTILKELADRTAAANALWIRLHLNESGDGWIVTTIDSKPTNAVTLP
jgi:molecular chaperone DnaK